MKSSVSWQCSCRYTRGLGRLVEKSRAGHHKTEETAEVLPVRLFLDATAEQRNCTIAGFVSGLAPDLCDTNNIFSCNTYSISFKKVLPAEMHRKPKLHHARPTDRNPKSHYARPTRIEMGVHHLGLRARMDEGTIDRYG